MDFLKFFQKHYEKVLLSLVLAALAAAAVFLLIRVSSERQEMEDKREMDVRQQTRPLPTVDLSTNEMVIDRLQRPTPPKFDGEHNLLNPVTWQRQDGNLIKIVTGREIGAGALELTRITPLMLKVSYDGASQFGTKKTHKFSVTREAHAQANSRVPTTRSVVAVGDNNGVFILREMQPDAQAPTNFVLEMLEGGKMVSVGVEAPYEGVAGYAVDLKYDPENLVFLNKRLGDRLVFAGDTNRIVAMMPDGITVEAASNRKRTSIGKDTANSGVGS